MAVKKCRLASEMTEKHKKRWQMEVNIMRKLDQENVISAMEVPPELEVRPNELPLLAMEYCSGGDLRRVRFDVCWILQFIYTNMFLSDSYLYLQIFFSC